jgi:hypothetical protein
MTTIRTRLAALLLGTVPMTRRLTAWCRWQVVRNDTEEDR